MCKSKTCSGCHREKGTSNFYKFKNRKGEYVFRAKCIKCYSIKRKKDRLKKLQETDPVQAKKLVDYRKRQAERANCPETHQWCFCCKKHLAKELFTPSNIKRKTECKKCFRKHDIERVRLRKKKAIKYLGGKCSHCGYTGYYAAFEFHHKDPYDKEMTWADMKKTTWDKIVGELDKCTLLCNNCHVIVHCRLNDDGSFNEEYTPAKGNER